jgi:hypothetical protein
MNVIPVTKRVNPTPMSVTLPIMILIPARASSTPWSLREMRFPDYKYLILFTVMIDFHQFIGLGNNKVI